MSCSLLLLYSLDEQQAGLDMMFRIHFDLEAFNINALSLIHLTILLTLTFAKFESVTVHSVRNSVHNLEDCRQHYLEVLIMVHSQIGKRLDLPVFW